MPPVLFERAAYHFYAGLALIALCGAASDAETARHQEGLAAHHRQLQEGPDHCPKNFASRAALIGAEIARLNGWELDAERLYDQANRSARDNGLVHNEALPYELGARFYAARGFETNSHAHLQNARRCYSRWGADGKVRQLDEMYPNLRTERVAAGPTGKIEAPIHQLDLATVVKVSLTVSSELQFEKLIETLLKVALEHAGAERGLLILTQGEQHQIEAQITTDLDQVQVQLRHAPITSSELPESLFRYVIRTQQKGILDDALVDNVFSDDEYLRRRRPRSILCLPLIKQTKTLGVLYLENNLVPRVFTEKRLAMLELLASQAAISLDHARLYSELSRANSERKRTEEELRRSEAFLAQGERISHTGSWRWHVATATVDWSEETFRILGANPKTEKPAYSLFMERVHREDRTRVEEILNRAIQDVSDFDFDYRIVLSNGLIKFLRSVGQPVVSSS